MTRGAEALRVCPGRTRPRTAIHPFAMIDVQVLWLQAKLWSALASPLIGQILAATGPGEPEHWGLVSGGAAVMAALWVRRQRQRMG